MTGESAFDPFRRLYEHQQFSRVNWSKSNGNGHGHANGHANGHASKIPTIQVYDAGERIQLPPPRGWLLGNQFCCCFVSSIIAPGETGKTAVRLAQLLSLATGRSLTGQHVFRQCRTLAVSLEDDVDEMDRRIAAACIHHKIDRAELRGQFFYTAPKGLKLAEMNGRSRQIGILNKILRTAIDQYRPNVLCLDPFVKLHALEENDNGAMDFVCDLLTQLAIEYKIAVDAPHHARKGMLTPGDPDMGRGASGIRDASRLGYTLTRMNPDEATLFSITEADRSSFIRLDSAKVNIARHADGATWFRIVGVKLGNGNKEYPEGDEVQTIEPWKPPGLWSGTTSQGLNTILDAITIGPLDENRNPTGQRYSNAPAAEDRAVWPVVQSVYPDKPEAQCRKIIHAWLASGLLYPKDYNDPVVRKSRKGLFVAHEKRPS
jgi:hypothetical protein